MKLTRQEILEIAKQHSMEYVHETYLIRFVEDILKAAEAKDSNGE